MYMYFFVPMVDLCWLPRFDTRYMKDALVYRGSFLWNTVCCNEHGELNHQLRIKNYFKDLKFDISSALDTCSNFVYINFEHM